MLEDSAEIQRDDAAFVSKKRAKQGLPPVEPLYYRARMPRKPSASSSASTTIARFRWRTGVTVTFRDAGHILGSAQVVLDIRENGRKFRYLFSGDIGRGDDDILRDPQPVENVDFLQVESTYGGREHSPKANANAEVGRLVRETLEKKGQGDHPVVLGRPHPADRLHAAPAHAGRPNAAGPDFRGQPPERERDGSLPAASRMLQRDHLPVSCGKRKTRSAWRT